MSLTHVAGEIGVVEHIPSVHTVSTPLQALEQSPTIWTRDAYPGRAGEATQGEGRIYLSRSSQGESSVMSQTEGRKKTHYEYALAHYKYALAHYEYALAHYEYALGGSDVCFHFR